MFLLPKPGRLMQNRTLIFLKMALMIFSLSVTIGGCSSINKIPSATRQGTEKSKDTPSFIESTPSIAPPVYPYQPPVDTTPGPEGTQGSSDKTPSPTEASFSTFYVSLKGNNKDGKSWDTAWNELDKIQWESVKPGDTIVIAGGEYHARMAVDKSGMPGQPITITTNGEQVILDGQRPALPSCGDESYPVVTGVDGIDLEGQSFIVIDGQNWRGIVIRNHKRGIKLREQVSNITVRNVEIYGNGWAGHIGTNISPDGPGVALGGSDILFERVIIHDNGQDAFQAGRGLWNFTLRNSWLYNSIEHTTEKGKSFNYCTHTDGIQIYDGGVQGPMLVEDSIIGPSFTQGIIIGSKATVDNVVIKNTLFVSGENAGIIISDGGKSSNWTLQHVTVVQSPTYESWSIKMNGDNHRIRDSVFWGGPWGIWCTNWKEATDNLNWLTPDWCDIAVEEDPVFVDNDYSVLKGEGFSDFDFTIQNPKIPSGMGSSITSVEKLLNQRTNAFNLTEGTQMPNSAYK